MRSWFAAVRDLAAPRVSRDGLVAKVALEEETGSVEGRAKTIRAMLERITQSPEFNATPRSRKFLAYIVEETLAGRAERIKAYSIATDVFGRGADFDAHSDPIVRLEAGRLRRALEHYYQQAGGEDPVAISIPKGGYIPQFLSRPSEAVDPTPALYLRRPAILGALVVVGLIAVAAWFAAASLRRPDPVAPAVPLLLIRPFEDLTQAGSSGAVTKGLMQEIINQVA